MKVKLRDGRDFLAGLAFLAFAGVGYVLAGEYDLGTSTRMGPGYVPRLICGLLGVLGTIIVLRSFFIEADDEASLTLNWSETRSILFVIGSVVFFGIALSNLGLILTTIGTVCIAATATSMSRLSETAALAFCLALFCIAIFVAALGLPFPIFPSI